MAEYKWLEDLEVEEEDNDALCLNCPKWGPQAYPVDLAPMWLHAVEYSSADWSFKCPPPPWSMPDWVPAA